MLCINGLKITIVRHSRRKNISLYVEPSGLIIKCPKRVSLVILKTFVLKNWQWVEQHLNALPKPLQFLHHDSFLYLGQEITLHLCQGPSYNKLTHSTFNLHLENINPVNVKKALQQFFQHEATTLLPKLVEQLAIITKLKPINIKIRAYKARWGSCSQQHTISLNWKLLIAPIETIQYVIIHELCHLQEFNHSKRFWALVEKYCPNYQKHKKWLSAHAHYLNTL